MHIYYNLADDVQRVFLYRFIYFLFLSLSSVYCIIVSALGYSKFWLIVLTIINLFSIANTLVELWSFIDSNNLNSSPIPVNLFDGTINAVIFFGSIIYFVKLDLSQQYVLSEFIVIMAHNSIIYIGLLCIMAYIVHYFKNKCCERLQNTLIIVENRNKNNETVSL